jgi:hypothetical protein
MINYRILERPAFDVVGKKMWIPGPHNELFGQFRMRNSTSPLASAIPTSWPVVRRGPLPCCFYTRQAAGPLSGAGTWARSASAVARMRSTPSVM